MVGTVDTHSAAEGTAHEVAFVDTGVAGWEGIVRELAATRPAMDVVVLDHSDGLAQMAAWAATHERYDAVHVIAHGAEGTLQLGSTRLDAEALKSGLVRTELKVLGGALNGDGDILLYGCDTAEGAAGAAFVGQLAAITGADVAASTDLTGAASAGGDWVLETQTGAIEASSLSLIDFSGTLDLTNPTASIALTTDSNMRFGSAVGLAGDRVAFETHVTGPYTQGGSSTSDATISVYGADGVLDFQKNLSDIPGVTVPGNVEVNMLGLANGNIVVEYNSYSVDPSNYSRNGNFVILDPSGNLVTGPVQFNQSVGSSLTRFVSMDELSNGDFVIGYQRNDNVSSATRIYHADGTPVGNETLFFQGANNPAYSIQVEKIFSGYAQYTQFYQRNLLQFFNNDGHQQGATITLSNNSDQYYSLFELSDGNLLVTEHHYYGGGGSSAQLYDGTTHSVLNANLDIDSAYGYRSLAVIRTDGDSGYVTTSKSAPWQNAQNAPSNYTGEANLFLTRHDDSGTQGSTEQSDTGYGTVHTAQSSGYTYIDKDTTPTYLIYSGYDGGLIQVKNDPTENSNTYQSSISANLFEYSAAQTTTPTLTGLNPSLNVTGSGGAAAPVLIDGDLTFTDPNFGGGTIVVSGLLAEDRVALKTDGDVTVSGSTVSVGGTMVGTVSGGSGATFTITLNASATAETVDTLLQHLTYADAAATPTTNRTLSIVVTDGSGLSTAPFSSTPDGSARFSGIGTGQANTVAFGDLNGDNRADMIVGQDDGTLKLYTQNVDGSFSLAGSNPFANIDAGFYSAPALTDLNGDTRLDLVLGGNGTNLGNNPSLRAYLQNPDGTFSDAGAFAGIAPRDLALPTFGDFDGDSDADLVLGAQDGTLRTFRNDGGTFTELTGASNPFNGVDIGTISAATFGDFDRDGDLDLVVGSAQETSGRISAFRNNGDGTFSRLTGVANPFGGITEGDITSPQLIDIDGDGTLDLVVSGNTGGNADGVLRTYLGNPSDAFVAVTVVPAASHQAPTTSGSSATFLEDATYTFKAADFPFSDAGDSPADTLSAVIVTSLPSAGTLSYDGTAITSSQVSSGFSVAAADIGKLTYKPAANGNGLGYASFQFEVQDDGGTEIGGSDTSAPATFTLNVTAVNDAPTLSATGTNPTYTEGGAAVDLFSNVSVSTIESGQTLSGAVLTVSNVAGDGSDHLTFGGLDVRLNQASTTAGADGIFEVRTVNGTATVTFRPSQGGQYTEAQFRDLIDGLTYYSTSQNPSAGPHVVTLTSLTDNGGTANGGQNTTSLSVSSSVTVDAVNDAPTATGVPSDITVASGLASTVDLSGIRFSDVDSGSGAVSFTIDASAGTLSAASGGSVTVSGAGTGALTLTGTAANIDAFLGDPSNISYTSAPGVRGNDAATLTLTANDNGHTGSGGGTDVPLGTVRLDVTEAPSLVVTTLSDTIDAYDNKTSLREALAYANAHEGADTITFASNLTGTVRLDGGDGAGGTVGGTLSIDDAVTIDGGGRITISGDVADNDATVGGTDITDLAATAASNLMDNVQLISADSDLTLKGLVLTGGQTSGRGGAVAVSGNEDYALTIVDSTIRGNAARNGGGVYHEGDGSITLTGSTVAGNSAEFSGGGIFFGPSGAVTLTGSTLSGNVGTRGGGLFADSGVAVTLTNTTVAGNTATTDDGGGVSLRSGSTITLTNTTVTGNVAAGYGGGIDAGEDRPGAPATTKLVNSIVAGNAAGEVGHDLYGDEEGTTLVFEGGNIIGSQPGDFNPVSGLSGVQVVDGGSRAAMESVFGTVVESNGRFGGVLADNGGPVQTVALASGSTNPALDASNGTAPGTDARGTASVDQAGIPNTNGSARDLGAYEVTDSVEGPSLVVTTLSDVVDAGDGQTSLREAVAYANAKAGADTISFASNLSGTVRLDGGDGLGGTVGGTLSVTEALTIYGAGRITLSGDVAHNDTTRAGSDVTDLTATSSTNLADNVRLIDTASDLTLKGLILTGGHVDGRGGAVNAAAQKTVTIEASTVAGNGTDGENGFGGAITGSTIVATGSTFSDNHASAGGGAIAGSVVTLTNSTVSGNSAVLYGGGLSGQGVTLTNTTVTGNLTTGTRGSGGGIYAEGRATLVNSIVLGNVAKAADGDEIITNFNPTSTVGGNIIGRDGGGGADVFSGDTDIGDTNAGAVFDRTVDIGGGVLAGVLADNGGPVQTVALEASTTNPAIDAADGSAPTTDSRGVARVDHGGVANGAGGSGADLGAYELDGRYPPIAEADAASVVQRATRSGNVLTNDRHLDGTALTVTAVVHDGTETAVSGTTAVQGDHGTLTIQANGQYNYAANVEGRVAVGDTVTDRFTYTASDGIGTDTASLSFSVTGSSLGNAGDNVFLLTGSGTSATGRAGDDTYFVDARTDGVVETNGTAGGVDTIFAASDYTLTNAQAVEVLRANSGNTGRALTGNNAANTILGLTGADTLDGAGGNDVLAGGAGADILKGGTGNDRLNGGTGIDDMTGGTGNDTYYVDDADDAVHEGAGGGDDTILASVDYILAADAQVETLRAGNNGLALTGNDGNNTILGGSGMDTLDGAGGDDTLTGGGNADRLTGGEGSDSLNGGTGADDMTGGIGNDAYYVDDRGDAVHEGEGGGRDTVFASVSYTLGMGEQVETLRALGGASGRVLTGNELNNNLVGNTGADTLVGAGGRDTLTGGAGNDSFAFKTTSDSAASAYDTIVDFSHAQGDKIDLSAIATGRSDGAFTFDDDATAFSGQAGELIAVQKTGYVLVQGDTDGNGLADIAIRVNGTFALQAGDFVL